MLSPLLTKERPEKQPIITCFHDNKKTLTLATTNNNNLSLITIYFCRKRLFPGLGFVQV